jgi:Tol biopolymer transport system component/DNA-binding winged helix-turn-helix (wHTH) protein
VAEGVDSSQIVRFGVFEVDLHSGELRKSGLKLKLTGQPFQVLVILLEQAGKVVTREELQKRLWPETFVDVDHNLNTAINKIRDVLGDSAENPRFVETLPRRGYRFILPLNGAHRAAMSGSAAVGAESVAAATAGTYESATAQRGGLQSRNTASHYAAVAAALLLCAGLAIYALTRSLPPPKVTNSTQLTRDSQAKTLTQANELIPPLVSDGSRLYFVECVVGGARLAQASIEGGETTSFPAGFRVRRVLDVSPKRQELLALAYDGTQLETALMVLPLPAGAPHRVGDVLAHDASWSPDGKEIVYANGHDLYVSKVDGSEPRKLVTTPNGNAWWPRWSSDGKLVRFTVLGPFDLRRIWEASADGSRAHPLFSGGNQTSDECCGNWTPDGKYFVFQSEGQLWAVRDAAGFLKKPHEPVRLTTGPMSMVAPLPSTDGKRIFVVAKQPRGQLVRYDGNSLQFVPFLSGISADGVDFSKDGQWVTYAAFPEGTLWRSRADGSERLQLTLPPMKVALPRWSPDGKRIAFLGEVAGRPVKLYIVSAEGGATSQAMPGERNEGEASWSPDGKSLAFAPLFWLEGSTAIRFLDMKTGQVTALPGSEGLFSARWSPDGRHIAALRANSQTLVLLDVQTQKWEELAKIAAYPNWSRDGSYIYFGDPYTNEAALYRVRISDRKVEQLATLNSRILTWASAGKWTGLAPDDSPLVLRDTSVEEIYALDWEAPK